MDSWKLYQSITRYEITNLCYQNYSLLRQNMQNRHERSDKSTDKAEMISIFFGLKDVTSQASLPSLSPFVNNNLPPSPPVTSFLNDPFSSIFDKSIHQQPNQITSERGTGQLEKWGRKHFSIPNDPPLGKQNLHNLLLIRNMACSISPAFFRWGLFLHREKQSM